MANVIWFGVLFVSLVVQIHHLWTILNAIDEEHRKKVPKDKQRYCALDLIFAVLWVGLGAVISLAVVYEIFTGAKLI